MKPADILARPSFRALAIPFGGPIQRKGAPLGVDLDDEWFDSTTEIRPGLYSAGLPVLFHHADDAALGDTVLGRAVLDKAPSAVGWWSTVTLRENEPAVQLIRALAHRTPLFVSSQPLSRGVRRERSGHITRWPLAEITLTPAPSNRFARIEAMPA